MSQLTHPRVQIFSLGRKLRFWLAVGAVAIAAAIPTVLVISDDDSSQSNSSASPASDPYTARPDEGGSGSFRQYTARPDEGQYVLPRVGVVKPAGQDTTGARP